MKVSVLMMLVVAVSNLMYGQSGNNLFKEDVVHEIRFNSSNAGIYQELYDNQSNYLSSGNSIEKVYSEVKITIDGNELVDNVGLRFKGETSFTQVSTEKKPMKVDINKFSPDQKYDGLKKFNLHNARSDASMLRDKISYDLLREAGVKAPRVAFAKVYINDVYWGLYSIVEQVNKTFLDDNFGNKDGNLYKATTGGSIDFTNMELKTNKSKGDFTMLNLLNSKIKDTPDDEFEEVIRKLINVPDFLTALAVDILLLDIDKFWHSGKNYYVYLNSKTGLFEFIPWDYNLAMNYIYDGSELAPDYKLLENNPLFNNSELVKRIMANDILKAEFESKLCELQFLFNSELLDKKIDKFKSLISADVQAETKRPCTFDEFTGNCEKADFSDFSLPNPVPGLKQFIEDRSAALTKFLSDKDINCTASAGGKFKMNNIRLYPNPIKSGSVLHIDLKQGGLENLELLTIEGRIVFSAKMENNSVVIPSHLPDGYYIYRIGMQTGKLIIRE